MACLLGGFFVWVGGGFVYWFYRRLTAARRSIGPMDAGYAEEEQEVESVRRVDLLWMVCNHRKN